MSRWIVLALVVALGACSKQAPEVVTVLVEPQPVPTPAECNPKSDPRWARLPDTALKKSDLARNDSINGRSFDTITGKRRDCWSVLNAGKKG